MKLFDIPETPKPKRKEQCRTCKHKIFITYRSGKRFHYCSLHKNARTHNGLLKVKCKREACEAYEPNK